MTGIGAIFRRAANQARLGAASPRRLGRASLAFVVAAVLLASALAPSAPARADGTPDPAARLQIALKNVHVYDDRDLFGQGEMEFWSSFCHEPDLAHCTGTEAYARMSNHFTGNTDENVTLSNVIPWAGQEMSPDVSAETGIPVYAGEHYRFGATIREHDYGDNVDPMGTVSVRLDAESGWGIGTYTVRSRDFERDRPGDFDITYEIRRVPLPDLHVHGFRIIPLDKGGQAVCAQIENIGERPAPDVTLTIRPEGAALRTVDLGTIDVNQQTEHCLLRSELTPRRQYLSLMIDDSRQVPEMDEYNNSALELVPALDPIGVAPAPVVELSPMPKPSGAESEPSGAKADLIVKAINVNGQGPDGKNDCKVGKNTVTVVVRNDGQGDARGFGVRLTVDGVDHDAMVERVQADREREVSFDNVQLKKGEHTLKTVVDPDHAVAESNAGNNDLQETVRCGDAA